MRGVNNLRFGSRFGIENKWVKRCPWDTPSYNKLPIPYISHLVSPYKHREHYRVAISMQYRLSDLEHKAASCWLVTKDNIFRFCSDTSFDKSRCIAGMLLNQNSRLKSFIRIPFVLVFEYNTNSIAIYIRPDIRSDIRPDIQWKP